MVWTCPSQRVCEFWLHECWAIDFVLGGCGWQLEAACAGEGAMSRPHDVALWLLRTDVGYAIEMITSMIVFGVVRFRADTCRWCK